MGGNKRDGLENSHKFKTFLKACVGWNFSQNLIARKAREVGGGGEGGEKEGRRG